MSDRRLRQYFSSPTPPPGYVPGAGRGAKPFTTRSDIGPAPDTSSGDPLDSHGGDEGYDSDDEAQRRQAAEQLDAQDREAEEIYAAIDRKISERKRHRRGAAANTVPDAAETEAVSISAQFADLKKDLGQITAAQWDNLPEAGRIVGGPKRPRREDRYTPMPDSVIDQVRNTGAMDAAIPPADDGLTTPMSDLRAYGQMRGAMLGSTLDRVSDSVTGQSVVDAKSYVPAAGGTESSAREQVLSGNREMFKALVKSNPGYAAGWISYARLEFADGKVAEARRVIARGCEACASDPDVWLEAARMNSPENAKIILANALRRIPTSVTLWMEACQLEGSVEQRRRVLRRALDHIPQSLRLWREAVELEENPEDAKALLAHAVECVPDSVELWLAYARLETFDRAAKILNAARRACPGKIEVFVAGCQLQESIYNSCEDPTSSQAQTALQPVAQHSASANLQLIRRDWTEQAELCEASGHPLSCQAIIRNTIGLGVESSDRLKTWIQDAEDLISRGSIETARAVYTFALTQLPDRADLWTIAADFEKKHGTLEAYEALLDRAVKQCPHAEKLWLMSAKHRLSRGDFAGARSVLAAAFEANANAESIWLSAVQVEAEAKEFARARALLNSARIKAATERIWVKSLAFERLHGGTAAETFTRQDAALRAWDSVRALAVEAIQRFPKSPKLYMIAGKAAQTAQKYEAARDFFKQGIKACPTSSPLWRLLAKLELEFAAVQAGSQPTEATPRGIATARAILQRARTTVPKDELIWLESVELEVLSGQMADARK
ncbi:hypothetical protein H696_02107 [Fonticula alba]|uniref:PRP1 splicing factor N-terminal domain-containing protein n=1 Tax=Fonticula alba TaxID=691883 RepID=A0A058ZCJ3_FONAL|nr:hypothetical protein H696_02107 [Fonticula alba]KCV71157.1 hypothetical protein H696_02107 [Fonticula alba]|eukprot:XP_009494280.1 hypothetical protein H696_02107 [Fonticula alba]